MITDSYISGKVATKRVSRVQTGGMSSRATSSRRVIPGSPFNTPQAPEAPVETFEVGDQVCHDRHGLGKVIEAHSGTEVVADFGSTVRRIPLPSTKLTKL
jgi:hypothetical protein